jgi:hypothetical protein
VKPPSGSADLGTSLSRDRFIQRVGHFCHGDRRHDLYRRCTGQRIDGLKIGKYAPPLLSCLAERVCESRGDAL